MKLAMIMAMAVALGTQAWAQDAANTWWGISNIELTRDKISFHFEQSANGGAVGGDYARTLDSLYFNKDGVGLGCAAGEHPKYFQEYGIDPQRLDRITFSYNDGGYGDPFYTMAFYPKSR